MAGRVATEHTRTLGAVNLAIGVAILIGGATRFPPPTYQPLADLVNGQVWPYGILFLLAGNLMLTERRPVMLTGFCLGVLSNWLLAAMFLVATLRFPTAGGIEWIAFAGYGVLQAIVIALEVWRSGVEQDVD